MKHPRFLFKPITPLPVFFQPQYTSTLRSPTCSSAGERNKSTLPYNGRPMEALNLLITQHHLSISRNYKKNCHQWLTQRLVSHTASFRHMRNQVLLVYSVVFLWNLFCFLPPTWLVLLKWLTHPWHWNTLRSTLSTLPGQVIQIKLPSPTRFFGTCMMYQSVLWTNLCITGMDTFLA